MDNNILVLWENEDFINWVLNPNEESNSFWKDFLNQHPEKEDELIKSKLIIQSCKPLEKKLSHQEIQEIWRNINNSIIKPKGRKIKLMNLLAVASIFTAIVTCSVFYLIKFGSGKEINYQKLKASIAETNRITLILEDNTVFSLSPEESELKYDIKGNVTVNSKIIRAKQLEKREGYQNFNQLIVPRGKQSTVLLADGTKMWLNSGSRVIYPVKFEKKKREVFIEGEVFLEVSHNEESPFIVKTKQMDIQVLGTSFNVNAYPEEKTTSVVLIEGKVKAFVKNHADNLLSPNQMISYNEQNEKIELFDVDVNEYVSWKEGWLLLKSEKLEKVFDKLSRYYNRTIIVKNEKINGLLISGKLDLKDNIEQVLRVISKTAPIDVEVTEGLINISEKINNRRQHEKNLR